MTTINTAECSMNNSNEYIIEWLAYTRICSLNVYVCSNERGKRWRLNGSTVMCDIQLKRHLIFMKVSSFHNISLAEDKWFNFLRVESSEYV